MLGSRTFQYHYIRQIYHINHLSQYYTPYKHLNWRKKIHLITGTNEKINREGMAHQGPHLKASNRSK
jgi:hypothetical protein